MGIRTVSINLLYVKDNQDGGGLPQLFTKTMGFGDLKSVNWRIGVLGKRYCPCGAWPGKPIWKHVSDHKEAPQ
jgi:hypothetical protein